MIRTAILPVLATAVLACSLPAMAQRIEIPPNRPQHRITEPEPARDLAHDDWMPYLEASYIISEINNDSANLVGGEIGYTLNGRFSLAWAATVLITDVDQDGTLTPIIQEQEFWWTGLKAEYRIPSKVWDHFSAGFSLLVGVGEIEAHNLATADDDNSTFLMLEPGIDVLFRVYDFLELGVGLSYSFAHDVEAATLTDDDLSVFMGGLTMRLREFW